MKLFKSLLTLTACGLLLCTFVGCGGEDLEPQTELSGPELEELEASPPETP